MTFGICKATDLDEGYRPPRAGVIAYTKYKGRFRYCLGASATYNDLTDFGGKAAPEDESILRTALREFHEETLGVFSKYIDAMSIAAARAICGPDRMILLLYIPGIIPHLISEEFNLKASNEELCEIASIHWVSRAALIELIEGKHKTYILYKKTKEVMKMAQPIFRIARNDT